MPRDRYIFYSSFHIFLFSIHALSTSYIFQSLNKNKTSLLPSDFYPIIQDMAILSSQFVLFFISKVRLAYLHLSNFGHTFPDLYFPELLLVFHVLFCIPVVTLYSPADYNLLEFKPMVALQHNQVCSMSSIIIWNNNQAKHLGGILRSYFKCTFS